MSDKDTSSGGVPVQVYENIVAPFKAEISRLKNDIEFSKNPYIKELKAEVERLTKDNGFLEKELRAVENHLENRISEVAKLTDERDAEMISAETTIAEYRAEVARLTAIIEMHEKIGELALTSAQLSGINSVAKWFALTLSGINSVEEWFALTEKYKVLVDEKDAEVERLNARVAELEGVLNGIPMFAQEPAAAPQLAKTCMNCKKHGRCDWERSCANDDGTCSKHEPDAAQNAAATASVSTPSREQHFCSQCRQYWIMAFGQWEYVGMTDGDATSTICPECRRVNEGKAAVGDTSRTCDDCEHWIEELSQCAADGETDRSDICPSFKAKKETD